MTVRTKKDREIWATAYEAGRVLGDQTGYRRGLEEGKKQEREVFAKAGIEARRKLAASYATVFEAVARSANMFFDGGVNAL